MKYIYSRVDRSSGRVVLSFSLFLSPSPSFRDPHTFNCYIYKGGRAWRCVVIPGRRDTTAFFFPFFFFWGEGDESDPSFLQIDIIPNINSIFSSLSLSLCSLFAVGNFSLPTFRSSENIFTRMILDRCLGIFDMQIYRGFATKNIFF